MEERRRGGYLSGDMERCEFILKAQAAGWCLFASNAEGMTFQCAHPGCGEAVFAPQAMIDRGETPDACPGPHAEAEGTTVACYDDAMRVIAEARKRLGVDQLETAEVCGLASGHVNKLEAGWRRASLPVLLDLAATLGLRLVLAPAEVPRQTAALVEGRAMRPMKSRWRGIPARRLGDDRGRVSLFRLRPVA